MKKDYFKINAELKVCEINSILVFLLIFLRRFGRDMPINEQFDSTYSDGNNNYNVNISNYLTFKVSLR